MTQSFDPRKAARYLLDAHDSRATYCNLPGDIAPKTVAVAYAVQQAFALLLAPRYGRIAGVKIATTTKVMQELMGIGHPCGGMIFERSIRVSPAEVRLSDYVNVMIECELAVRLGRDLPEQRSPYTRQTVSSAVAGVMATFELIEDRNETTSRRTRYLSLPITAGMRASFSGPRCRFQLFARSRGSLAGWKSTAVKVMSD
jgi:2-keto-4-pentenoate hydratase